MNAHQLTPDRQKEKTQVIERGNRELAKVDQHLEKLKELMLFNVGHQRQLLTTIITVSFAAVGFLLSVGISLSALLLNFSLGLYIFSALVAVIYLAVVIDDEKKKINISFSSTNNSRASFLKKGEDIITHEKYDRLVEELRRQAATDQSNLSKAESCFMKHAGKIFWLPIGLFIIATIIVLWAIFCPQT